MLRKWDELPDELKIPEVKPYYDHLVQKKKSLCVKRILDIVIAVLLTIILSWLLIILSLLVGLTSRGGVFFRQVRVTQYGRTFRIFKFRTMVAGADRMGAKVTMKKDSRVTKVGRFLRKVRLDELPQLFNIISGDMTIVGTRPEVQQYVNQYTAPMKATLLLPAGVTSKASIEYKDEEKLLTSAENVEEVYVNVVLPEKMKYNLAYLEKYSLRKDIKLMISTVVAVLH